MKKKKRMLKQLEQAIFFGDYTNEQWLQIDKEIDEAFISATDKEIRHFVYSGAGEMLEMVLESLNLH